MMEDQDSKPGGQEDDGKPGAKLSPPYRTPDETDRVTFLSYAMGRYQARTGSLFLDGLVGGMFLSFLMDTGETCMDRNFTQVYFVIGIFHFICGVVENLAEYADQASAMDGTISTVEGKLMWSSWLLVQILRIAEVPMVVALGYFSLKFSLLEGEQWTHDREKILPSGGGVGNCTVCFCEGNYVHLAQMTFAFQMFLTVMLVSMWFVMWYVDSEDDEKYILEQEEWKMKEEQLSKTWLGKIRETILLIGMHSFYNSSVAGTMLALSVALPHENCNIHVMEWFLYAGIIYTLTGVINQVRERVEEMAILDGIVNKAEHKIILVLKFCNFPLFLFEFVCFIAIVSLVTINYDHITVEDKSSTNEHFCESGTWKLMLAMTGIYSIVFLFRVMVVMAR